MEFEIICADPYSFETPALIVGCFEDDLAAASLCSSLNDLFGGLLEVIYSQREFNGSLNKTKVIHCNGQIAAERLVLVGLGKRSEFTAERMRQAAGSAIQALNLLGISSATTVLHRAAEAPDALLSPVIEGFLLGSYTFSTYKTIEKNPACIETMTVLLSDSESLETAVQDVRKIHAVCMAVSLARDLVSQPGNVATPSFLADRARQVASQYGFSCQVLGRDELERLSMNALLAVARGSHQQPQFIVLEYLAGPSKQRPVVLVGKGVTFDSGGISLKPREGMEKMKTDMAGAAAVIATMQAVAALKLPLNVVGLVPAAENLPGGSAYKPGDVIRTMSGKTVEIVNTDAEGRMLLCDAMSYADRYRPSVLIDIATLTGACVVALGSCAAGIMGNDKKLMRMLSDSGERTGERIWELPLWEEYGELMKSDIADLKNAGGPEAGSISAAWFLSRFAGSSRWAHLDIAGVAWEEKGKAYRPKGATGVGVRLLVDYLRRLC